MTQMPPLWQTEGRQMTDMKRGGTLQLTLIMLQTKYQNNPAYRNYEYFDKNCKTQVKFQAHITLRRGNKNTF